MTKMCITKPKNKNLLNILERLTLLEKLMLNLQDVKQFNTEARCLFKILRIRLEEKKDPPEIVKNKETFTIVEKTPTVINVPLPSSLTSTSNLDHHPTIVKSKQTFTVEKVPTVINVPLPSSTSTSNSPIPLTIIIPVSRTAVTSNATLVPLPQPPLLSTSASAASVTMIVPRVNLAPPPPPPGYLPFKPNIVRVQEPTPTPRIIRSPSGAANSKSTTPVTVVPPIPAQTQQHDELQFETAVPDSHNVEDASKNIPKTTNTRSNEIRLSPTIPSSSYNVKIKSKRKQNLHYPRKTLTPSSTVRAMPHAQGCYFCGEDARSLYDPYMEIHMRKHTHERGENCPHCPFETYCPQLLREHVWINHKEEDSHRHLKCSGCYKQFSSSSGLKNHYAIKSIRSKFCLRRPFWKPAFMEYDNPNINMGDNNSLISHDDKIDEHIVMIKMEESNITEFMDEDGNYENELEEESEFSLNPQGDPTFFISNEFKTGSETNSCCEDNFKVEIQQDEDFNMTISPEINVELKNECDDLECTENVEPITVVDTATRQQNKPGPFSRTKISDTHTHNCELSSSGWKEYPPLFMPDISSITNKSNSTFTADAMKKMMDPVVVLDKLELSTLNEMKISLPSRTCSKCHVTFLNPNHHSNLNQDF